MPNRIKPAVGKHCVVCGRDLSKQQHNSRVCSTRIYGDEAKSCRKVLDELSVWRMKCKRAKEEREAKQRIPHDYLEKWCSDYTEQEKADFLKRYNDLITGKLFN